ncbi:autotransporter outer membrane beta-barrel domain-containing protein [Pelagibacterium sp. H642]|uniref:autotransporter family protein n=1 Tax=Pelagibacterium sp. H642 TaxID=1881069 RepID=UPI002815E0D9|nr:autotransporter outer membrane beta-barrel domain-containing protein [Pelagibacterium sp. H642]WMT91978.1 autotransporter outer membrane beta-barrel domain-containing protein [Pelagibacterium sp. H642]
MAAPGTVTVDNSLGDVTASGIQFASDGYLVAGDELTLVPTTLDSNGSTIRVGDGTHLGADFTATMGSVLNGDVILTKTDLGTLVLDADNTYTGGTAINGGIVQISSDTNLGLAGTQLSMSGGTLAVTADVVTDRDTLLGDDGGAFDVAAGVEFTQTATISGPGGLTKTGEGLAVLTGNNTYAGGTTIAEGTLQLGSGGTSGSILGDVTNDGELAFNRSDTYTFEGVVSGSGSLSQIGRGTTILTGNSIYGGGTTISDGTLQLGAGDTTGSIVGDVANDGTLVFNRSATYTFGGEISGTGAVEQIGSGTTVFTGDNTYSGATTIAAGKLAAGATNTFSPNSVHDVATAGTLDLAGFTQTVAGVTNAGRIFTNGAGPETQLIVNGSYTGLSGLLGLNTYLGADASPSDRLVINGGSATGTTSLAISNVGGLGALTTGSGILVVDATNGATTSADAFVLAGPVVAGPYEYSLFRGNGNPEAWYLRSTLDCSRPDAPTPPCPAPEPPGPPPPPPTPDYRPETSLYAVIPSLALDYGNAVMDSLDERMGGGRSLQDMQSRNIAWGRIIGLAGSREGGDMGVYTSRGPGYDYDIGALQAGIDLYRAARPDGSFDNAGIYFAYGYAGTDVSHVDGSFAGSDSLNASTLGGYWTHFGQEGWYLDGVVQGSWYDISASGRLPGIETNAFGFGASLEGGYPIALDNGWVIEPQAQLSYQRINLYNAYDVGAAIRFDDAESLVGRLGLRLSRTWDLGPEATEPSEQREATGWMRASVTNEFLGKSVTQFSSQDGFVPFQSDTGGIGLRLDAGLDAEIAEDVSLYGNFQFQHQFDAGDYSIAGKIGLKVAF